MHGRYFKHNTTVEFYDGKDNNSYWTHIATIDLFDIEECITKYSMYYEQDIENYIKDLQDKGIDVGNPIHLV